MCLKTAYAEMLNFVSVLSFGVSTFSFCFRVNQLKLSSSSTTTTNKTKQKTAKKQTRPKKKERKKGPQVYEIQKERKCQPRT